MATRKKLKFDESWDGAINRVYQMWYGNPEELKRSITKLYAELREAILEVERLTPHDEELDYLIEDWWELLGEIAERTISYWDAGAIKARLEDLKEEFLPGIETEIRQLKSRPPPKPVASDTGATSEGSPAARPKTATKSAPDDLSDNALFARAFGKTTSFGAAKAKRRPKDVRPKAQPWVPPTPQEEWADEQRKMGRECDEGYNRYLNNRLSSASDHAVNQQSVSNQLGAGRYFQVRPSDNTNDQMRIYIDEGDPLNDQYWARGLSHDAPRRAGAFYVYRRTGRHSFVHVGGRRLEKHQRAL